MGRPGTRETSPVTDGTIYHWASITKTFTGIGIMQLRDRGLLSLDDPVVKYVPELRLAHNPFGDISQVKIRHLMSHSAGFRASTWPWGGDQPWHPFEPTTWEQLVAMLPYTDVQFEPGSKYSYSNPGVIFLGRIIQLLSGDDYEVYITKNILMPLGMHQTFFDRAPYHLLPQRSHSYFRDDAGIREARFDFDTGITVSNGGLNSPFDDMAKYLAFLLGAGSSRGTRLIRRRPQALVARRDVDAADQGGGRGRRERNGFVCRALVLHRAPRQRRADWPQRRPERLHLAPVYPSSVTHGVRGVVQHRYNSCEERDAAGHAPGRRRRPGT